MSTSDPKFVVCNVCGRDERAALYRFDRLSLVRCPSCGLVYVNPQPPESEVEERYDESYFKSDDSLRWGCEDIFALEGALKAQFAQRLEFINRPSPSSSPPGGRGEGVSRVPVLLAPLRGRGRGEGERGRLLDVGCAMGWFLELARGAGWETDGVDLSPFAARYAREKLGLRIHTGFLDGAGYPPATFDVVTCWDVVEHTRDPGAFLKQVAAFLKPGGRVFLTVPNIGSWPARLMGSRWYGFNKVQEHLYYFTPKTLCALLTRAGLRPRCVRRAVTVAPWDFLVKKLGGYSRTLERVGMAVLRATGTTHRLFKFRWLDLLAVAERP